MPLAHYPARPRARFPRLRWLALLLLVACGAVSAAERVLVPDFILNNWDLDDGLRSTCINGVARAPNGYLWLATYGGLVRFDGFAS